MNDALLSYLVDPTSVDYSVGTDRLSVVDVVVSATNGTDHEIACSSIAFEVVTGWGKESLTADPSTVAVAAGAATPWAIGGGDGTWTAVPLPPVTTVPAGGRIEFRLADVIVNDAEGYAEIHITEVTDASRETVVSVHKAQPAPDGTTPTIDAFTADPPVVALGGTTTLSWATTDADRCVLGPGAVDLPDPHSGRMPLALDHTTVFVLDAVAAGGRTTATVTATVGSVEIVDLGADPAGPVAAGAEVTLHWQTRYAASCSIDQGIGPVAEAGTTVVRPARTTVYTLSALGLNSLSRSVTVEVT